MQGKLIATLVNEEKHQLGMHIQRYYPKKHNLAAGVYFFVLETEDQRKVEKFIVR